MIDCFKDGIIDTLKLLPYLFITFIILEYVEHKISKKNEKILINNKKYGTFIGSFLGALPQCGFSSMAANLFSGKIITIGTLVALFLSTSDEMLPIMISEKVNVIFLLKILLFKVIVGIIIGIIVDCIYKKNNSYKKDNIKEICEHDHCDCEHDGIIISSLKHTLKICLFILIINIIVNITIFKIGTDHVSNLLLHGNIFTYFIASLIGLIPNCAGSIIITELYLAKFITLGNMLAGLLTGSGLGILLLFKTNKNVKENLTILTIIYSVGVLLGLIIDLII